MSTYAVVLTDNVYTALRTRNIHAAQLPEINHATVISLQFLTDRRVQAYNFSSLHLDTFLLVRWLYPRSPSLGSSVFRSNTRVR
jgi:hypothetical protein